MDARLKSRIPFGEWIPGHGCAFEEWCVFRDGCFHAMDIANKLTQDKMPTKKYRRSIVILV